MNARSRGLNEQGKCGEYDGVSHQQREGHGSFALTEPAAPVPVTEPVAPVPGAGPGGKRFQARPGRFPEAVAGSR